MQGDSAIVDLYVTRLLKEINDLNANRFMVETRSSYYESMVKSLQDRIIELEDELRSEQEKHIKRENRLAKKEKEIEQSETF